VKVESVPLKILPAYTGAETLAGALADPKARRLLWLEILLNDRLDPVLNLSDPEVRTAYEEACRWYTSYRSLIETVVRRAPLPPDPSPVDQRNYRTFVEALRFAADHR
jgi:hypothetical protein